MTDRQVEIYRGAPVYPGEVIDQGGYQTPYPHPMPPPAYPSAYPPAYPGYPPPGYLPYPEPETPRDRLYYVNGVPHVKSTTGQLVPLHPPRSHLHRNPWVMGYAGLIVVAGAATGLFIVAAALYALIGAATAHLVQIGGTLAAMVATFLLLAGAVTKMRHGHRPR